MRETLDSQGDGRTRRKIAAMRRVQAVALDLFEARGFGGVSIEEIASAAEVGPATVYRNFGTKERIVLWDEYDPLLFEALARELVDAPILEAVPRALTGSLARIYTDDGPRILRRARLIRATESVQQVAAGDTRQLRLGLAAVLLKAKRARDPFEAAVFAGAIATTLEAAIDHWLDHEGEPSLARTFGTAFKRLRALLDA